MKRYLVWSLALHCGVFVGGAMLAPLHGFMGSVRPDLVITVGLVDYAGAGKPKAPPAKVPPPPAASDQIIATRPSQDQTPEKLKDQKPEAKETRKAKQDSTRTKPPSALAQADTLAGLKGTLTEGTGEGDVWGVETGAGVNPYHRAGFATIRSNWRNPVVGPIPRKCVVKFRIKRSGEIVDVELERHSGSDLFDRAALRAVNLTHAWPPFPATWEEKEQIIHLEFEYRP
ncbi:MAG: TonB family protein [Candidatus Zixiibacteriota bacterium]